MKLLVVSCVLFSAATLAAPGGGYSSPIPNDPLRHGAGTDGVSSGITGGALGGGHGFDSSTSTSGSFGSSFAVSDGSAGVATGSSSFGSGFGVSDGSAGVATGSSSFGSGFAVSDGSAGIATGSSSFGSGFAVKGGQFGGRGAGSGATVGGAACSGGLVRHLDGSCVQPVVSSNVFMFAVPAQPTTRRGPAPNLPAPRVEHNIVFIRTPEQETGAGPIVVPPPQQRTQVYVLAKKQEGGGQQVIEVPAGPAQSPEVFFVNYSEGENPQLPGGVDLQTALSGAAQSAQVIGDLRSSGSSESFGTNTGGVADSTFSSDTIGSSSPVFDSSSGFSSGSSNVKGGQPADVFNSSY